VTFALGWLAILGLPPFSGFWSKDAIIEAAFTGEGWRPWVFGMVTLLGAGITAFYMSRLFFMTFHGKRRWNNGHSWGGERDTGPVQHPHEAPLLMTVPMIVLAVGSAALGGLLAIGDGFSTWLEPVTGHVEHEEPVLPVPAIVTLTLLLVVLGLFLAWRQYALPAVPITPPAGSVATRAARQDLYQDVVNDVALVQPGQYLTRSLVYGDRTVVDGAFGALGRLLVAVGDAARAVQTGFVRSYAATMTAGLVVLVAVVLATRI
jgi:NADH-quinone oxidoreductase subunit L